MASRNDKFIAPAEDIQFVSRSNRGTLLTEEALEAGRQRIAAGESPDDVALDLAIYETALISGLSPDAQKALGASESAIHTAADKQVKTFANAVQAAFVAAQRKLKATHDVDATIVVLKKTLGQTLPALVKKTLIAGGQVGAILINEPRTAALRTAKRGDDQPKVNVKFKFDTENQDAIDWADQHAAELIDDISETSREAISNAIADLLESGDWADAVDEILNEVGDPERALRIARHETMLAVSEGQRQAWDQAVEDGSLDKSAQRVWITVGDEKVCPICEPLDGKTADLDGEYDDGIAGPPAHVMCRCTEGLA